MARVLVCGTLAYDDIGVFATPFTADTRNVKLERLDRGFGGCAMNVAYNLAGLGHQPVPFVYAGEDYSGDYARHVARAGISEAGIFRIGGTSSARGIVLTGCNGVQFTAFYPGPSGLDRWQDDLEAVLTSAAFDAAVLAPDLPGKMLGCARRLRGVPLTLWCPGQYAELLDAEHIEATAAHCDLLVANRHEWHALERRVPGVTLLAGPRRAVVTDGAGPVEVLPAGQWVDVPALPPERIVDPTGCGDAFVAGLAHALLCGAPLAPAAATGIDLAGRCIGARGAQSHAVPRPAGTFER